MNVFLTEDNKMNYPNYKLLMQLFKTDVTTEQQYFDWVKRWKELHSQLYQAIQELRVLKNQARKNGDATACNLHWRSKKGLGRWAHAMYSYRVARKQFFKDGRYVKQEQSDESDGSSYHDRAA